MEFPNITINQNQTWGTPYIRNLLPVATIVEMFAQGKREAEILEAHPKLEAADISEALHYAATVLQEPKPSLRVVSPWAFKPVPKWTEKVDKIPLVARAASAVLAALSLYVSIRVPQPLAIAPYSTVQTTKKLEPDELLKQQLHKHIQELVDTILRDLSEDLISEICGEVGDIIEKKLRKKDAELGKAMDAVIKSPKDNNSLDAFQYLLIKHFLEDRVLLVEILNLLFNKR